MVGSDPGEWAYEVVTKMDERWSQGWRSYVQPQGGLEGRGTNEGGWDGYVPPSPLWASKATPTPQEARSSSLGLQDLATLLPHCSLPCSCHTSCILLHTPTWAKPHAALEGGPVCTPPQGCLNWPAALSVSSGPPLPGPCPGAQTWALRLAAALSKVVFRSSDLQVLFSIALGEPGAPSTRGHP